MTRQVRLKDRQLDVLGWVGDGCPTRSWPDESHKTTARALAGRGLVEVKRKQKQWTATLTARGETARQNGYYTTMAPGPGASAKSGAGLAIAVNHGPGLAGGSKVPPDDSTARLMRRVAGRARPREVRRTEREIREVFV